jgi:hypothetical protein
VTLPSLNSVVGRVVTWTLTPVNGVPTTAWCTGSQSCDLATQDPSGTDASLRTDHTASFAYTTNTESPDQHSRGAAITTDSILVRATVSLDTTKLSALIKGLILGSVPGRVGVVVGPMFKALTSSVLQQIASLAQPTFFRYVLVDHHASPARLASRSCTGLFVAGDFPGEDGQVESGGGNLSVCDFYYTGAGCSSQINDTFVQLEISPNATEAHLSFLTNQTEFAGVSFKGVGDEAFSGPISEPGCGDNSDSTCKGTGAGVRVANDVLTIQDYASGGGSQAPELLAKAVAELCLACKFPTSPSP